MFEPRKSHCFVDLDELIRKMYTVLRFQLVFNQIIKENWKKILNRNKSFLNQKFNLN